MFIKPLEHEYHGYDVFIGYGWENWIRVKLEKNKLVVLGTTVEDLDPKTTRLIFFKIKKLLKKEKEVRE